jgi:hypothetical protein
MGPKRKRRKKWIITKAKVCRPREEQEGEEGETESESIRFLVVGELLHELHEEFVSDQPVVEAVRGQLEGQRGAPVLLVVLCAALSVAHVLLYRLETEGDLVGDAERRREDEEKEGRKNERKGRN